jgi:hypothetical protein
MPGHWDWPLAAPLTVSAKVKKIVWDDVWTLPSGKPELQVEDEAETEAAAEAVVEIELVPYGCSKVYHVSMFPYV